MPTPMLRTLDADVSGIALQLPYLADTPLDAPAPWVRQVLLVLHGIGRDADAYFAFAARAAEKAGQSLRRSTLVVAPRYPGRAEARRENLGERVPLWRTQAWKEGEDSVGTPEDPAVRVSSFAVLDAMLAAFADRARFPALESVVLVGHSAGGQFVQHYVATSDGEDALAVVGVRVRYIVANPSSYLYLDGERPGPGGIIKYPSDAEIAACPGYNDWKYGLGNLPAYPTASGGAAAVRARYERRDVVYLVGERDTDPLHPQLDRSCAAMLQGRNRLARAAAFQAHLERYIGPGVAARHRFVMVPRVGHNARRMLKSSTVRPYLFDSSLIGDAGASSDSR